MLFSMLYRRIHIHNTYTNICGNIVNNNDDFNKRTDTLLYKNIPLTLYFRKGNASCVWEVSWRRGQTATYWPQVLLTIAALLSHSGWAAQPWDTEGPRPPSGAGSHSAVILSPTDSNCNYNSSCLCPGYIFVWRPPAAWRICHHHRIQPRPQVKVIFRYLRPDAPVSLFFRLFIQVHLLIDGSVEGQYVTSIHM